MSVKSLILFALLSAILFIANAEANTISCKDGNGNNIDWFYLYKLPGQFGKTGKSKGTLYAYMTSNADEIKWTLANNTIDDVHSIAGQTLAQSYFDSSKLDKDRLLVAYNDEPPRNKPNLRKGHLKGVVTADDTSGFWLIHSVPRYPDITDNEKDYTYPESGHHFGQSFLCLSLPKDQLEIVANQLIFNEPQIFASKISDNLINVYPTMKQLIDNSRLSNGPYWNEATLKTLAGNEFKAFAKSGKFMKELYEDWVAPMLGTNLYVETWRRGPGNLPSNCSKANRVWNISKVRIQNVYEFTTEDDHSKWGVSDQQSHWICVGDINRASTQMHRGGGTVCKYSKLISDNYRSMISDFEPCIKKLHRSHSMPSNFHWHKFKKH